MRKKKLATTLHNLFCECLHSSATARCETKSDGTLVKSARPRWARMAYSVKDELGVVEQYVERLQEANLLLPFAGVGGLLDILSLTEDDGEPAKPVENIPCQDGISNGWFDHALSVSVKLSEVTELLDMGEPNEAKTIAQQTVRHAYDVITQALAHIRSMAECDAKAGVWVPRR